MLRLFQQLGSLPLSGLSSSTLNPNKLVAMGCELQKEQVGWGKKDIVLIPPKTTPFQSL
jgi:hypothetical protein